ncbi:hypothetical protein O9G_006007 [Rozella allomycis CSF55]|uniref:Uncharacterized protein n=1 Tax=Rozella allomycis (strain CSF55) TaxID=988480 RepID=A0A075APZ6_ROZAC|nr:hypothetical protein O9G_006007 [Rozella allomycis CSF55]|eukprot:EPZ32188.1 hypothetical protein O9G_006007 [Rozella allomycis CSF55]
MSLSQQKYIEDTLVHFNVDGCKCVTKPQDPSIKLSNQMCPIIEEDKRTMQEVPYRETVGRLKYLAGCTRPDIMNAVIQKYVGNPGWSHWIAVRRILTYLAGFEQNYPTKIQEDNESAKALVSTNKYHSRTKHIDTVLHFIKDKYENGKLLVVSCNSEDMVDDIFTKGLYKALFDKHRYTGKFKMMLDLMISQETTTSDEDSRKQFEIS